jgi:hypothetical protein
MAKTLALSLLGPVAITQNGEPVGGQIPAKSQALLCYLAVTGQSHSREKSAGLFWGGKSEANARANLGKSLTWGRWLAMHSASTARRWPSTVIGLTGWMWRHLSSALTEVYAVREELQPFREAVELDRGVEIFWQVCRRGRRWVLKRGS